MKIKNIYLLAQYKAKPIDSSKTSQLGYVKNEENLQYDERVVIQRGLKTQDERRNNVVIDLTEEKVIKNNLNPGVPFYQLFAHFHQHYSDYISKSVDQLNQGL